MINKEFWNGKTVLVTGHTGFKGCWLTFVLSHFGANVVGIGLDVKERLALSKVMPMHDLCVDERQNINDIVNLRRIFDKYQPDIVFHLAAQALVSVGYEDPILTFQDNVMGTVNVLECIRKNLCVKSSIIVTTDKVYKNNNSGRPFVEDDILGANDPYSASKAACEIVLKSYINSFITDRNKSIASVRAGNVIGGGDWAKDRLVPDLMRHWYLKQKIAIKQPNYTRPWQHVLDPINMYLCLAEIAYMNELKSDSYNIGPNHTDVLKVIDVVKLASSNAKRDIPAIRVDQKSYFEEAKLLSLDSGKIQTDYNLSNKWNAVDAITYTTKWYNDFFAGNSPINLMRRDVEKYFSE